MPKSNHLIAQITEEEAKAKAMLEKAEKENAERISTTSEQGKDIIQETEDSARNTAQGKIEKAKEKAKSEYKEIIVKIDNERRDIVEGGKKNLSKAEKIVNDAFAGLFN